MHISTICNKYTTPHSITKISTIFKTITDESTLSGQRIVSALQARKIAQEQAIKQMNLDIQCLKNYENACKNGTVSSDDFTIIMGKASTQAQEYSKNIKEGTGSAQIYADKQKTLQQSIQNTGTASRVAAVGVKALSIAGNMLAGMAISFAISKVIEGIEYLATASERAIEKTKELQQEISQISSDYQSERQTLEGLRGEYDALTSKIGENGAEASLSADEYERYRDITSEILGITPKLITGWDEEGRAISNKNNLLQMSIDLLDEEYQKSLRNSTTKSKNEEIAAGIIEQKKDFDNSGDTKTVSGTKYDLVWKDLEEYVDEAVANEKINYTYKSTGVVGKNDADAAYAINEFVYGDDLYKATEMNTAYGWLGSLQERITSSQENFEKFANSLSNEDNPIYQWFTDEQIDELIRGADEYFQELARIEGEEQQYFQQYKDQLNLNAQAVGDAYSSLDEQTKAGITQMIDSFDYNDMTKEKFSDMATDLKDFVGKLSTDDTLLSYFNNLFKPIGEDESIEDYESRVKTGIDEITSYCENNYPAIKLSFGDVEKDVEDLKLKYNTAISKFTGDANDVDLGKFFEDNSINDESEIDYWNKVTDGAKSASEAVEMYNNAKKNDNKSDILSISETIDKVNTQLKPSLDSLKTVYQSVFSSDGFTLDDVDVSMLESLKSSLADLKENGIDVTTEDFENFARVITDSSTEETQAQEAFDQLATTLVNSSKATLVSDDAFNTLVQTLEQLGITNAEEALQGLRDIQSEIASKGYDLANITNEQAAAFINEGNASAEAVTYLQYYMIQKQLAEQPLKTSADIKALEDLCNSLGITGEMYQEVIKLKTMMNAAEAGAGVGEFDSLIAASKAKIEDLAKNQYTFGFKFEPTVDKDKASGSAKDIAEEFKNLLDAELKVLDTKMDAGLINFNDYIAQRLALIQKYYDEGKIKAADYYEYLSKHYETQLSYMDKVSSYVTTTIDKQIDAYNKQIEQIKDRYQSEIDYLDTVIEYYENQKTALQDANNERDRQLALQKALYDLEKAQTQRTIKLYADNHGYIYRADGDAIRDAQDQVDKAKLDIQIAEIDKAIKKVQEQQDALKKAMDKEVEAINKIIENLEAYKEKWNSVAKEYEERQNEMIAQQMYGADIEKEILAGRLEVLEDFKNKYLAIQQAIKDANANAAQAALNDAKTPTTSGGGGTNNSSGNGSTTKTPVISDAEKKRIQEENKKKKYTGGGGKNLVAKYASGTKNAKQGIHEVAEDGDEIIRDNYGNAYIAKGHQLHNFEGGETVYDAEETKKLLGGRLVPVENIIGLNESATNLLSLSKNPKLLNLKPQFQSFDFSFLKDIGSTSSNEQVVVTQNVNVTLPNITNESGFNNFKKELDRLKLDAYQFANKRIK